MDRQSAEPLFAIAQGLFEELLLGDVFDDHGKIDGFSQAGHRQKSGSHSTRLSLPVNSESGFLVHAGLRLGYRGLDPRQVGQVDRLHPQLGICQQLIAAVAKNLLERDADIAGRAAIGGKQPEADAKPL